MRALRPVLLLAVLTGCAEGGAPQLRNSGTHPTYVATTPNGCRMAWLARAPAAPPAWSGACNAGMIGGPGTLDIAWPSGPLRITASFDEDGRIPPGQPVMVVLPNGDRYDGPWSVTRAEWSGPGRYRFADGRTIATPQMARNNWVLDWGDPGSAPQATAALIPAAVMPRAAAPAPAPAPAAVPAAPVIAAPATPATAAAPAAPPAAPPALATPGLPAQPAGIGLPDPHRHASPGGQDWIADQRSNCRIHDPWVLGPHRVTWSGPCVNGRAEGNGVLVGEYVGEGEAHTDRYEGPMRAGKRHGRGVTTFTAASRTDRTEATWRDGVLHGPALITSSNGYRFQGNVVEGRTEGRASLRYSDGGSYEGEFAAGQRSGRGVVTWADGGRCEGLFREDRLNGQGVCAFANGSRHEGGFVNGQQSGRGVMTYAAGHRYDGDWREGQQSGRGVMTYANGSRYEGEWLNGKWQGRGVLAYADGARYDGEFRDGQRSGRGVMVLASGNRYDGEWLEDRHHGRGSFQWTNGNVYDGNWRAGRAHGQGSDRHFGEWASGWFEDGCLRTTVGSRRVARWVGPTSEDGSWCQP